MKKLVMTRGLPASGKSSWASAEKILLEIAGVRTVIVNKDDIRNELIKTGWIWSQENEKQVIKLRNSAIAGAFAQGASVVISSDTNFGKHEDALRGIAKQQKADFEIKDFTNVPVEVCIQRDAQRTEGKVGAEVIKQMYNQYLSKPEPYTPDWKLPSGIICDLDGTLALHVNRSPYDLNKVGTDKLNESVADIVKLFAANGFVILYTSGREDSCREQTIDWLVRNGLPLVGETHKLFMRSKQDARKDDIVKLELFDANIRGKYNVRFVLDDRDRVVKMWREIGLTCLQCAEGAF